jgi:hypothetical protein
MIPGVTQVTIGEDEHHRQNDAFDAFQKKNLLVLNAGNEGMTHNH